MVSSALNTLRGIPEQQATNYNDYLIASTKIRQRVELDGDARVFQISRLALAAQVQNQSLLDTANANDARLQAIVAPSTDASEAALSKVRWIYSLGLSLQAICIQLVADGDKDGFKALRQVLPWQIRASKPGAAGLPELAGTGMTDYDLDQALRLVSGYERKLLTPAEQAARLDAMESASNMGRLKDNWLSLDGFFAKQLLPGSVAGMFQRLVSLYAWFEVSGLDSDGSFIYVNQGPGSSKIMLTTDIVAAPTWGTR